MHVSIWVLEDLVVGGCCWYFCGRTVVWITVMTAADGLPVKQVTTPQAKTGTKASSLLFEEEGGKRLRLLNQKRVRDA